MHIDVYTHIAIIYIYIYTYTHTYISTLHALFVCLYNYMFIYDYILCI